MTINRYLVVGSDAELRGIDCPDNPETGEAFDTVVLARDYDEMQARRDRQVKEWAGMFNDACNDRDRWRSRAQLAEAHLKIKVLESQLPKPVHTLFKEDGTYIWQQSCQCDACQRIYWQNVTAQQETRALVAMEEAKGKS